MRREKMQRPLGCRVAIQAQENTPISLPPSSLPHLVDFQRVVHPCGQPVKGCHQLLGVTIRCRGKEQALDNAVALAGGAAAASPAQPALDQQVLLRHSLLHLQLQHLFGLLEAGEKEEWRRAESSGQQPAATTAATAAAAEAADGVTAGHPQPSKPCA